MWIPKQSELIWIIPFSLYMQFGKRIANAIIDYLKTHAHPGAFTGLMAVKGVSKFYERYGFTERSNDNLGMFMRWEK